MINIDLTDFIEKVQTYQKSPYAEEESQETLYSQTIKRRDIWDRLHEIDDQQTRDVILKFLIAWKCHLSYNCTTDLTKTFKAYSQLLASFNIYNLQDVGLDFFITDNSIQEAFRAISSVKDGRRSVGTTATSKIFHMINPNFFVMSDHNIRYGYGCSDNELGYVNFMWHMKLFSDALLKKYSDMRKVSKENAFQGLRSECKSSALTLPKLLDEYNWIKYNP